MPSSILSSLLSKSQFTVAKSETGEGVLSGIKVKRVRVQLAAYLPRHMREDGTTISDTRVIRPTVVMAEIICPTLDDAESVIKVMNDRESLYTIYSKGLVFANMMVQAAAIKQSAEMISAAPFQIIFKELLQENVNPVICSQGGDSDTQSAGIQILKSISNGVGKLVTTVTNKFTGA